MDICGPPRVWSSLVRPWPLLHAFDQSRKDTSTRSDRIRIPGATTTGFHVLAPTFRTVATAYALVAVGALVSLALLFLWRSRHPPPKPQIAALSESTVLRIYEIASRQPYQMAPDGDDDPGTFAALPFARNPRKQSLFIFWFLFLLVAGMVVYFLRPFWLAAVSEYMVEKHAKISWTVTVILSVILGMISGRFLQFVFFFVPIIKSTFQWISWIVLTVAVNPAVTASSAYMQVTQISQYLSHWYLGIPFDHALSARAERSTMLVSNAISAAAGYHLISSRVARNYTLILKSLVQGPLDLFNSYVSLRHAPFLPTNRFQIWAWWAMRHSLRLSLGELSWASISYPKLSVLLTPALTICAYSIYKYNQAIIPPRSAIQLALNRLHGRLYRQEISSQRRDVEIAEIKRILQNLDHQFANFSDRGFQSSTSSSRARGAREAPF
ncbi:hypothetical protein K438DRAFT_1953344 [Mycena galopus ATCC 62051]|nr:hypothetical protein K438DRAFT_1953344 [Mycena galopus ATCC 62051]